MDLRQLRYFVAVAEELHFSRAAERLYMAQPPLSRQIRELERSLGVQLLVRNKRRVALTEAGERFLAEARTLLEQAGRAVAIAQRIACGELGSLEIGYANTVPYTGTLSTVVGAYRRAFPGVNLTLGEMTSQQQIDGIAEGRLDIGFVRPHLLECPSSVSLMPLFGESFLVALPETHPLAELNSIPLSVLADQPFIFYPPKLGTGVYEQVGAMCREAGFAPRIVQEAKQAAAIMSLVAAGLGVSLVPASLRCVAIQGAVYRPLEGNATHTEVALAHRAGGCGAAAKAFIDIALLTTSGQPPTA